MANNTIFDNVFRTMLEKMPELVVPLINEVFGTNYPADIAVEQQRNEHQTKNGDYRFPVKNSRQDLSYRMSEHRRCRNGNPNDRI